MNNVLDKQAFLQSYILARAGAISGSVTADKLVASAAKVWQEMQYELGLEERPVPPEAPAQETFDVYTGEVHSVGVVG